MLPQPSMVRLQFNEIPPSHTPSARACKIPILIAQKPFGMVLLQRTAPTGMIDNQVEEKPPAPRVHGIGQLTKLLYTGSPFVELNQGGINIREVATSIRTPKAPHARIRGGGRIDGQQMQNPAPQGAHYVWQFGNDITKGAAWRDDAVAFLVEPPDVFVIITFNRAARELVWAKHSRETAVNRVRTTSIIGVHRKPQIFAIGPVLLAIRIDHIRLGLKPANLG